MILPSLIRSKPDLTVLSAVTLISLLVCSLAFGQIPTGNQDPLENLRKLSDTRSASTIALEATVDPAKYVLGPGDKLTLSIWGDIELTFKLNVSPEGSVSIPAIGSVKISGLTIADAEKLLIEKSRSSYSKADISLELIGIRMMKVSISGAVKEPGVYTISAIDRLSSLIQLAKGLYDPEVEILPEVIKDERKALIEQEMKLFVGEALKPSTRKIVIIDLDNKTANVDYLRYQRTGNLKYNPILKGGDQISVKRMDSGVGVIQVFGAVMIPGEYEFVDGDNLSGIIEIAGGFQSGALLSEIAILRFEDGNTKRIYVDLSNVASDNGGYLIRNDDRIFVRRQLSYRQKYHVEIKGEVNFPGTYPIEDDDTKLSELIENCGGFTGRANLGNSKVFRFSSAEIDDPEYQRLLNMPVAAMTNMEYEFFKSRTRERFPQVVVDFERLFKENDLAEDITLRDRDIVDVPILSKTVNVIGSVLHPGLVRFVAGENYQYYIRKAGGFTWNANKGKVRLQKADNRVLIKMQSNIDIEIGDTIFVPEEKEVDWWSSFKDFLMVVSQLATTLAVVISLSN